MGLTTATLLDLLFDDNLIPNYSLGVLDGLNDCKLPFLVGLFTKCCRNSNIKNGKDFRNASHINVLDFLEMNYDHFGELSSVDTLWHVFKKLCFESISRFVPEKTIRPKRDNSRVTREIINLKRRLRH